MGFFYKLYYVGLNIISVLHVTQSMILLTANVDDLRRVAEKFLPEPMIASLQDVLTKLAQEKSQSAQISKENDENFKFPLGELKETTTFQIELPDQSDFTNLQERSKSKHAKQNTEVQRNNDEFEELARSYQSHLKDVIKTRQLNTSEAKTESYDIEWTSLLSDIAEETTTEGSWTDDKTQWEREEFPWNKKPDSSPEITYKRATLDEEIIRPPRRDIKTSWTPDVVDLFGDIITPVFKRKLQRANIDDNNNEQPNNNDAIKDHKDDEIADKVELTDPKQLIGTSGLVKLTRQPEPHAWWESKLVVTKKEECDNPKIF